jgi:hypothetical protein
MAFNGLAVTLSAIQGAGLLALQQGAFGLSAPSPVRQLVWSTPTGIGAQTFRKLIPDVVVNEHHQDDMVITRHPVERGAAISDHAYKLPSHVTIRAGWSEAKQFENAARSSSFANLLSFRQITNLIPNLSDPKYLLGIYEALLSLQTNATLITVVTGKRIYGNMLITSLSHETDSRTEHALIVDIRLEEIIMAQTRTLTLPEADKQALAPRTAAPVDQGTKSAIEVEPLPAPPGVADASDFTTQRIAAPR